MKIKVLAIGSDCVSLFVNEDFVGYVGINLFYFDSKILKWYNLFENILIDEFRPRVRNNEFKLNSIHFVEIKK